MQSLRSSPITEPSTLLRTAPPLCPASVLWSLRILPLGRLPWHRDDRFSRSIQEPDPTSRRLNAGCRTGNLPGALPCLSREKRQPPVLTSSKAFRHFIDGSLALASSDHTCRNLVPTFLQRSPRSLLTAAACSGLRPAPDCRPRGAHPHLSYGSTPPLLCRCVRDTRRLRPLIFLPASWSFVETAVYRYKTIIGRRLHGFCAISGPRQRSDATPSTA